MVTNNSQTRNSQIRRICTASGSGAAWLLVVCMMIFGLCFAQGAHAEEGQDRLLGQAPLVQPAVDAPAPTLEDCTESATLAVDPSAVETGFLFDASGLQGHLCGPSCESSSDCVDYCLPCSADCEEDACPFQESDGGGTCVCTCH